MRSYVLSACAFLVAVAVSGAADPKAVIEAAIKAHGGKDAHEKFKGSKLEFSGEMELNGMSMEFEATALGTAGKMKSVIKLSVQGQKIEVMQVTDGKSAKSTITAGGMTMDQPLTNTQKDELIFSATTREMTHLVPLLDAKKYELKAEDDAEVESKKADVLSAKVLASGRTMKFYFDKESNLLVKTSYEGLIPGAAEDKKGNREALFSDYKKVDGIMVPMKIVAKADDKVYMTAKIGTHTHLEKVDDKEFAIDD